MANSTEIVLLLSASATMEVLEKHFGTKKANLLIDEITKVFNEKSKKFKEEEMIS